MKIKLKYILLFSLLFILIKGQAQNKIDSLEKSLLKSSGSTKTEILNKLATEYFLIKKNEKSIELANQALLFARGQKDKKQEIEALQILCSAELKSAPEKSKDNAYLSLTLSEQIKSKDQKVKSLNLLAKCFHFSDSTKSIKYSMDALSLAESIEDKLLQVQVLDQIVNFFYYKAAFDRCLFYNQKRLDLNTQLNNKVQIAQSNNVMGVLYKTLANYQKAIEYYLKTEKIQQEINDQVGRAKTLFNIGNVFYVQDKYDMALTYYTEALKIFEKLEDPKAKNFGMANTMNSIGLIYNSKKEYKQATDYYMKSLAIYKEFDDKRYLAATLNNLGEVYLSQKKYKEADNFCLEALEIYRKMDNVKGVVANLKTLGEINSKLEKYPKSIEYYESSILKLKETDLSLEYNEVYKNTAETYALFGNYQKAYTYYREFSNLKDSVLNQANSKQLNELGKKYQTEKKELQIKNQETEIKQRTTQLIFLVFGIIALFLVIFLVYTRYRMKTKANQELSIRNAQIMQQKEEIEAQRDEIEQKANIVVKQKQEITDSIHYASRIQRVILPPLDFISSLLPDHFVLYKPRDIVSGDYYWAHQRGNKIIITAADCTGHGVPGAFMSMLGISFLNEIANQVEDFVASDILEKLREYVITSLRQTGKENEQKDGMDIALLVIDKEAKKAQYAGAYNSLYLVRNKELIEYKADKMPIGIYFKGEKKFTNNIIEIKDGDRYYICSDGYSDQFGGPQNRKFMSQNLKKLLLEIHLKPMIEQRNILEEENLKWRGDEEQVDDILVIGVQV